MGGGAEISLCKRGPCCAQGALIKDRSRHREKVRGRLADIYCIPRRNTPARLFHYGRNVLHTLNGAIPRALLSYRLLCAGCVPRPACRAPIFHRWQIYRGGSGRWHICPRAAPYRHIPLSLPNPCE